MTAQQQSIDFGKTLKEAGMRKAVAHANQVHPDWSEKVYWFFKYWIRYQKQPFKMESFREWCKDLIPEPPSLRAYGPIPARAKKEGLIVHAGYAQVENAKAHRANCSLWRRV